MMDDQWRQRGYQQTCVDRKSRCILDEIRTVFKDKVPLNPLITLWWTNIAMENHHFSWENPLFLWPFSIAMLVHQRVIHDTNTPGWFGPPQETVCIKFQIKSIDDGWPNPLKNMKVRLDHHPNYWENKNVPNHQPVYIYIYLGKL